MSQSLPPAIIFLRATASTSSFGRRVKPRQINPPDVFRDHGRVCMIGRDEGTSQAIRSPSLLQVGSRLGSLCTDGLRSYFIYKGCIENFLKSREGSGHGRTVDHSVVIYNSYGHFTFPVYTTVIISCCLWSRGMQLICV